MGFSWHGVAVLLAVCTAQTGLAQNDTYTFLFKDGNPVHVLRTNNHGVSLGLFFGVGLFLKDGQSTLFPLPCNVNAFVSDINDAGDVTGGCGSLTPFGFLRKNTGAVTTLQVPGEGYTVPEALNNGGVIAGTFELANPTATLRSQPFLFQNGVYTKVTVPGAFESFFTGINDSGDAIGNANTSTPPFRFPFLYRNGSITLLPTYPGFDRTGVEGINNRGEIVGGASTDGPNGVTRVAFILRNGQFETIRLLPGLLIGLGGINDKGEITGSYQIENSFEGTSFIRQAK